MKNVQMPYELFVDLVLYHLNGEDDFDEDIRRGLEQKLDAMLNRQLYSQYKTALTGELLTLQLKERQGVNEVLKARDQMAWVGACNNIRNAAEEIALSELIYS